MNHKAEILPLIMKPLFSPGSSGGGTEFSPSLLLPGEEQEPETHLWLFRSFTCDKWPLLSLFSSPHTRCEKLLLVSSGASGQTTICVCVEIHVFITILFNCCNIVVIFDFISSFFQLLVFVPSSTSRMNLTFTCTLMYLSPLMQVSVFYIYLGLDMKHKYAGYSYPCMDLTWSRFLIICRSLRDEFTSQVLKVLSVSVFHLWIMIRDQLEFWIRFVFLIWVLTPLWAWNRPACKWVK